MFKVIKYFYILFIIGCAAIGPPSGGDKDKIGPQLLSIYPLQNVKLVNDKNIIFEFDELIDPISVPNSIKIDSSIKYKLKIRGRKIILQPNKLWPKNNLIRIDLSRKIRDYQKNMMSEPISIIYSTGKNIPKGKISGEVIGSNNDFIELGLYSWPISDSSKYIQKIESDKNGFFQFNGVLKGEYTIVGVEGILNNINEQIERKKYTLLTSDFISFSNEETYNLGKLLLSEPIKKKKIISIEMLSQYSFNLLMDDNSKEYFMIDSIYAPGDTISIIKKESNHIESYMLPEYLFVLPEILDTIGPQLKNAKFIDNNFTIIFSEPVDLKYNAIATKKDSSNIYIEFNKKNNNTIILQSLSDTINSIQLLGDLIIDWSGNTMIDSVKLIEIEHQKLLIKETNGGNILGSINYDGNEAIIIEAYDINNNKYFYTDSNDSSFVFENLPAGYYILWGFEKLNNQQPNTYFSGTWAPYQRAAKFSALSDTIDVRNRWDIEGVIIEIN